MNGADAVTPVDGPVSVGPDPQGPEANGPDTDGPAPDIVRPRRDWAAIAAVVAVMIACLPVLAVVVTRTGRHWLPVQDLAVIDLRVRDVFSYQVPLTGVYSRFGWNHPGPLMYYLLAVPSRLFGGAAWATLVGAALLQGGAIVWLGLLSWRVGRLPLVLCTMTATVLSYASTGTWMVLEPWNPHVAFPWLILLMIYTWRVALGETERLVGFVFVASFLVQLHVGYALFVLGAGAVIAGYLVVDVVRKRPWNWSLYSAGMSIALLIILWAPPVVEGVVRPPGNFDKLWEYFTTDDPKTPVVGLGDALSLFGFQYGWPPEWLTGSRAAGPAGVIRFGSPWLVLVPVGLLLAGGWLAWMMRRRDDARLVAVTAVAAVVGLVALSRVTGDVLPYLFYWRIPLALMIVAVTALVAWHRFGERVANPRVLAGIAGVLVIANLVAIVPLTRDVVDHGKYVLGYERSAEMLFAQLPVEALEGQTVLVWHEGSTLGGIEGGLIDWLDRKGVQPMVNPALRYQFGSRRGAVPETADHTWAAIEEGVVTSSATIDPANTFIARIEPLGPEVEARVVALQVSLVAQLRAIGRPDLLNKLDQPLVGYAIPDLPGVTRSDVEELARLNTELAATGLCRCSIVEKWKKD